MIEKYLAVPAYGKLSSLELASIKDSEVFDFTILDSFENFPLMESENKTAQRFAKRLGGFYKLVRICGTTVEELLERLPLPETAKFNWTISGYGCNVEILEDTRAEVSNFLNASSLGKARYVKAEASIEGKVDGSESALKLVALERNVLSTSEQRVRGLDIVVHCTKSKTLYGYTEFLSDLLGYEKRDFSRSYQDPTTTIGPRLARILVNLASMKKGKTVLDPFCGLGTILQEALICGYNVVGGDISQSNIRKTITNLEWLKKEFQIPPKLWSKVVHTNSTKLQKDDLPQIDGIATEPLLVPKFKENPSSTQAGETLREVKLKYESMIRAFGRLLAPGRKAVLVVPGLIEEKGKVHSLEIENALGDEFALFRSYLQNNPVENPTVVNTGKKKIVQRRIYVMVRR